MRILLLIIRSLLCVAVVMLASFGSVQAQSVEPKHSMEIYGHIMMDAGYNFDQVDPDWFDIVRPTRLPAFENQYGTDGNVYFSVRQTRLGFKTHSETPLGELFTFFEFEMFGTGADAGQTTFRLRHAYAELGQVGVGQYWSPFMDIDVFPNTLEYWGPNGMVLFRNVQFRYMPIQGDTRLTIALERPGASADQGIYADRIELEGVSFRFPLPDLSAEYRQATEWGYLELAGMLRSIRWEDQNNDGINLSGSAVGWGLNLSTNINIGQNNIFKGQAVYGEGVENYMNDATVDIGIENTEDAAAPVEGVALPMLGLVAFLDHRWNERFTSSIGYSLFDINNSDAQSEDAFSSGSYVLANLLFYPVEKVMAGVEFQWANRENYNDGWSTSMTKIQFSFKYNFTHTFFKN